MTANTETSASRRLLSYELMIETERGYVTVTVPLGGREVIRGCVYICVCVCVCISMSVCMNNVCVCVR